MCERMDCILHSAQFLDEALTERTLLNYTNGFYVQKFMILVSQQTTTNIRVTFQDLMDSDEDSISSEGALNELLGLPMTSTLKTANWDEDDNLLSLQTLTDKVKQNKASVVSHDYDTKIYDITKHYICPKRYQQITDRAYSLTNNSIESPPVTIVDLSEENMGNILVATRFIQKGEVIFTEKSLVSAQQPKRSLNIRACQMCFKSLEPGSCLSKESINELIPLIHLWPIQEMSSDTNSYKVLMPHETLLEDMSSGIVICKECDSLFCCKHCCLEFQTTMGSCCSSTHAVNGAIKALCCLDDEDCTTADIDPVYALASKMFCMLVHRYRSGLSIDIFDSNCGRAEDVTLLKLGSCNDDGVYSMVAGYEAITNALSLTIEERQGALSINLYHKVAAIAQRNGVHLCTSSPFRDYYQAMLRWTGGRGSSRQKEVTKEIAKILGASDGKLSKEMDRMVEEKVRNIFERLMIMKISCPH